MSLIKETDHYGWTPIHYAAYYNQYQQIHVLLENDQTATDIADKDRKMTALHLAAGQGHARTVETILFLDPKCYELVDHRGWNFLHYAMVSFKLHELKILLKNPLARSLIYEGDNNGNTPLHVLAAIRPKEFFKIKVRYDTGGNYGAVNKQNVSVIDVLIYGSRELKVTKLICSLNLYIKLAYFIFHYFINFFFSKFLLLVNTFKCKFSGRSSEFIQR